MRLTRTSASTAVIAVLLAGALGSCASAAAVLTVGPGADFRTIGDAARAARDGDTVDILPGVYRDDVTVWPQRLLTIRGQPGKTVLDAQGTVAEGKAIWVFRRGDFIVEGIEFRGARAGDRNGAGIRFEAGRLTVKRCVFVDNENGILTANDPAAELVVEDSEFSQAPRDRGPLMHLLYVGHIARFAMRGSRLHQAFEGHLLKSRARVNDLRYNMLYDGPGGTASYELEFPNGGKAIVVGNVIGKSATATNPVAVAFGAEGAVWPDSALYLVNNTLTSDRMWGAWFLRVFKANFPQGVTVVAVNNLTVGVGIFSLGANGTFSNNYPVLAWALGDPATLDFMLGKNSWLRGTGTMPPSIDGESLAPTAEFRLPIGTQPIDLPTNWTPGAFQTADPRR
jgi:hypothetical protein